MCPERGLDLQAALPIPAADTAQSTPPTLLGSAFQTVSLDAQNSRHISSSTRGTGAFLTLKRNAVLTKQVTVLTKHVFPVGELSP